MAGALSVSLRLRSGVAALTSKSPLLSASLTQNQPNCSFISKALRDPDYKRPAPYPYETREYTFLKAFFDHVTTRMDENSKIIVIDGPPTGGKTDLAKTLAEELDMLHIGPANLDDMYINEYGQDLRALNDQVPERCRTVDFHQFLENPTNLVVSSRLQYNLMFIKFNQYVKAIAHLLNTGQGIVMNRSIYSDFVFIDTLVKHNFLPQTARTYINECKQNGMWEFLRPHLLIYLDIPVDKVLENVKARNKPYEVNSPFYTPEVLKSLETSYKQDYLKSMRKHCEIMVYDWSEGGDSEVIVEDVCRLDMDKYTHHDTQFQDWNFRNEWDWKRKRIIFSSRQHKDEMHSWLLVPKYTCEQLRVSADDVMAYESVLDSTPGYRYASGYDKEMGDKILFNMEVK